MAVPVYSVWSNSSSSLTQVFLGAFHYPSTIGVARIFQRGSHCVKVRGLTRLSCRPPRRVFDFKKIKKKGLLAMAKDIVMAFSPPVR